MGSNRKFKNGMYKDLSTKQERKYNDMFLTFQASHGSNFHGMSMMFNQITGECEFTYNFVSHEYHMTLNRDGSIVQEGIVNK